MNTYTPSVAVSKENGLKMTVNDPMTDHMMKNPEKTAFVAFESGSKSKTAKGKTDNEQEIV
ncbi:hypothetical protein E4T80_09915 [Muribacter muris]|uniref:Uncharacterized protein n=1 Tax=Muribacter muris TaxID=67855 RepID=A0A4Y9JVX2_9PAST|nr:hypothetical protein [Muribacter muris]MBF0785774.1 hypothetical protein [Muribacter muris]MBF0828254.1 hypothetical protein [Muribacter muris]TFV08596.1 hypothetical protein E4T80_09915 [Muribacter muris]